MKKPNIIYIFADQLRYDSIACNGNKVVKTPNIDRLASQGVSFDQAISASPVCSPYRGQILTGCYSHVNGVICNEYALFDDQTTIAQVLKNEGYKTAYIGKWHLGYGPYTEDKRYGFDDMYAYNCNHRYYDIDYWHNEEGPFKMVEYAPRHETNLTIDYLKDHQEKNPDDPFAVFLSWGPPHWTLGEKGDYSCYPQEYNIYDPDKIEVPENVPKQMADFAVKEMADYYGMVTSLDDCLGQILKFMEDNNLTDNTILCFTSDHGDHLSSHGFGKPIDSWMHHSLRGSKATPYEESIHIPFIMRYPEKVKGNKRTETLFSSVDVLPTLLSLCDIEIPEGVQGTNLAHTVLGIEGEEPESAYLQIMGPGWPSRTKWVGLWRGVRTKKYIYARWFDCNQQRVLYDIENDPQERHNLVEDPEYKEVSEKMEVLLKEWLTKTNDPFETGRRLPKTEILDIGQKLSSNRVYNKVVAEL